MTSLVNRRHAVLLSSAFLKSFLLINMRYSLCEVLAVKHNWKERLIIINHYVKLLVVK